MSRPLPTLLAVAAGGALGSVLRYAVGLVLAPWRPGGVPVATLLVNVTGSALLCFLLARQGRAPLPNPLYLALTAGILGGFTTYSAFTGELVAGLYAGRLGQAFTYLALSLVLGLAAGALGWRLGS